MRVTRSTERKIEFLFLNMVRTVNMILGDSLRVTVQTFDMEAVNGLNRGSRELNVAVIVGHRGYSSCKQALRLSTPLRLNPRCEKEVVPRKISKSPLC